MKELEPADATLSSERDVPVARERPPTSRVESQAPRPRPPLRLRPGTLVTLGVAVLSIVLAWSDPFAEDSESAALLNNRTGGRRVFPALVDADPAKATIELRAPGGPLLRIAPGAGGHELYRDDVPLGPVSAEVFDGLWSSLRLANAMRPAPRNQTLGVGKSGFIRVSASEVAATLSLGDEAVGGGVYAALEPEGGIWVVEAELRMLVEQPPESWLSTRLLAIDPDLVTVLTWGDDLVIGRGNDGFWRVREGAPAAMLSTDALNLRLRRLLRTQLDPMLEREAVASESLIPWLVVTTFDGETHKLSAGGECPGHPDRRIVDRGPGLVGCLPAHLLERWPLHEADGAMVESRLIPHEHGRIVGIDLEEPVERSLLRRGGNWLYDATREGGGVVPVSRDEVERWYGYLSSVEVSPLERALGPETGPEREGEEGSPEAEGGAPPSEGVDEPLAPDWVLVVHADTDEQVRIECRTHTQPVVCERDGGPRLRVLGEMPPEIVFDTETFADRTLTQIAPGEVRELEIMAPTSLTPGPPPGEDPSSPTVRQRVRADLGVWQLEAPEHVDGNGAVDEVRLETLLWALRQLRAEAWVDRPVDAPLRQLLAEVIPHEGKRQSVRVVLYPDCVVEVEEHRAAQISAAQCEALGEDLFFDDPLRFWLERSRSVEIGEGPAAFEDPEAPRVFVRRREDRFVAGDGRALDEEIAQALQGWIDWRSQGIRAGEPPSKVEWTLDIRRDLGPPVRVEIGEGWMRLRGQDWYYAQRRPEDEPPGAQDEASAPGPSPELDDIAPDAVEID